MAGCWHCFYSSILLHNEPIRKHNDWTEQRRIHQFRQINFNLCIMFSYRSPLKRNKALSNLLFSAHRISNTLSIHILPFVVCISFSNRIIYNFVPLLTFRHSYHSILDAFVFSPLLCSSLLLFFHLTHISPKRVFFHSFMYVASIAINVFIELKRWNTFGPHLFGSIVSSSKPTSCRLQ